MQISTSVGVVQYICFFLHSIKASNINYVTPRLQDGSAAAFYLARQAKTLPSSFAVPRLARRMAAPGVRRFQRDPARRSCAQ